MLSTVSLLILNVVVEGLLESAVEARKVQHTAVAGVGMSATSMKMK